MRYAILFDFDMNILKAIHPSNSIERVFEDIDEIMLDYNFKKINVTMYLGDNSVSPVQCVIAIQALIKKISGFKSYVRDVSMLYIKDIDSLMPVILGY